MLVLNETGQLEDIFIPNDLEWVVKMIDEYKNGSIFFAIRGDNLMSNIYKGYIGTYEGLRDSLIWQATRGISY